MAWYPSFHFVSFLRALKYKKRDSAAANLASPRDLRMASEHGTDVPVSVIANMTHSANYRVHQSFSTNYAAPFQLFNTIQHPISRPLHLSNHLNGAKESSIPTLSRSMDMELNPQIWWWKKWTRQATLVADPWNTSSMESLVMCEIDMARRV